MKQFLWTNKVMLLILLFDQSVSSRTSNWPKYKQIWQELLQIEYCATSFYDIIIHFCASESGIFMVF